MTRSTGLELLTTPPPQHPVTSSGDGQMNPTWYQFLRAWFRQHDRLRAVDVDDTHTAGSEHLVVCDATDGDFTVTLPAAASSVGRVYTVKKTDASANVVTVDANSSETIDGATTTTLTAQYQSVTVACDGTEWHII